MADIEIPVLCYWNGCVKYGPDGVYYEGPTPTKISVKCSLKFSGLMDQLYGLTGLDRQRSKFDIAGRYPSVVQKSIKYVPLHVVNDTILETMLEVPSNHPCIKNVELYFEVKTCRDVIDLTGCSPLSANLGGSSKRQRTEHPSGQGVNGMELAVKLAANNDNVPNVCLNNGASSSASKPLVSSLWIDDHDLRVGLCFKDRDELKKVVEWCAIRGQRKCFVEENEKEEYTFECISLECNWSLCAAKMEGHGLVEITECSGPHTCCSIGQDNFIENFAAKEIECLIRVHPSQTIRELKSWWLEKFGYDLTTSKMKTAKQIAIKKIYGDWDQSFRVLPKLMAALQSSNGLVVDWQYDLFSDPEFFSFRGVFWAFAQSIKGFPHCRPLILVETKDMIGKYPMKLMIASGLDANRTYFPLAFAVTTEVSSNSWRWFLSGIREKVTLRKELCLISSPDPDILTVINEPGSLWKEPWAYHRFCLDHFSSQFDCVFKNSRLKSLVEDAGLSKKQDDFDFTMQTIKMLSPEARQWLDQIPPHQWACAHDGGRGYGVMSINIKDLSDFFGESFQSLDLSVTATVLLVFDEMRSLFLGSLESSEVALKCGKVYIKPVLNFFEMFMSASTTCIITPSVSGAFRVTESLLKDGCIVRLNECTCTCGDFQFFKVPCHDALVVCEKLKINPLQYVDENKTLERLHKTYASKFSPVPEISAWPEASDIPTLFPPPLPPTIESGMSLRKPNPQQQEE